MKKEWFTILQLRAAHFPDLNELYLRSLVLMFDQLPADQARTKVTGSSIFTRLYGAEFHISLLPELARAELQAFYASPQGTIIARIQKLGIHHPVSDQRSRYSPQNADAEIALVEQKLRERNEHRAV